METQTYINLKNKLQDNFPEEIICHHSGGVDSNPLADTSNQSAQDIEAWHLQQGWEGVGYHYIIVKNGDIWKGRPETYHGSHTVGENTKSIGICLVGNFDLTFPTKEQINSLTGLLGAIIGRYPAITKDKIYPHRKFAKKTCYGSKLSDNWASNLVQNIPSKDDIKKQIIDLIAKL